MKPDELKEIIVPVLNDLRLCSQEAIDLLIGTCLIESDLGKYVKQINGPAKGIYQCEPNTLEDIWKNFLRFKASLIAKMAIACEEKLPVDKAPNSDLLITNHKFSTAVCRIHYYRVAEPIPSIRMGKEKYYRALAAYYKKYYNTIKGKCSIERAEECFREIIMERTCQ